MRIAFLITHMHHIGGAQQVVHQQAEALSKSGHDVHVLTAEESVYSGSYTLHAIPHLQRDVHFFRDGRAVRETRRLLRNLRPDVLTIHSTKAGTIGRLAAVGTDIPIVYTFHGVSYMTTAPFALRILGRLHERLFSLRTHRYVFLNQADQQTMRLPGRKCTVIPNGMNERPLREHKERHEGVRILWVGRLSPPKDPLALLECLANFPQQSWHLDMIGTGSLAEDVDQRIREMGLEDRVTRHGEVKDPHPYYENCDLVVLLSKSEGMPLVLLEAMAHHKPVIASRTQGIDTLIEEGRTGYIVRKTLTPYLDHLFRHPEKLEIMGKQGYERFRKYFTFQQMIRATEQLLIEVAKKT